MRMTASFIEKNDSVLDLGCDHGYLAIYLKKNNLCKNVIASDISSNALDIAKNMLVNNLNINLIANITGLSIEEINSIDEQG